MSSAQYQSRLNSIPEADGLRATAATLVFLFHAYGVLTGISAREPRFLIENLICSGATGVTLFFLLSGFLLSRPFLARGIHPGDATVFLKNRLLRIYPMFIAVLVAGIFVSTTDNRYWAALKALFMIFDGYEFLPFSVPWWTLRTELEFYLLMTLVLACFNKRLLMGCIFLFIFSVGVLTLLVYQKIFQPEFIPKFILLQSAIAYLPVFMLGIGLSFLSLKLSHKKLLAPKFYLLGDIVFIFLVYLLCVVLNDVSKNGTFKMEQSNYSHHYIEALCWGGILATVIIVGSHFSRVFSAKVMRRLGDISYSLYLVHLPCIFYCNIFLKERLQSIFTNPLNYYLVITIVSFFVSVLVASLCYMYIEKPFLRLKAKNLNGAQTTLLPHNSVA
jgi:peptidoglycan/LPS O-acetylase OafA/YrhL